MKMYFKQLYRRDDALLGSKDYLQKLLLREVAKTLADEILNRLSVEDNVYWEDENNMRYCTVKFDTTDLDKEVIKNENLF